MEAAAGILNLILCWLQDFFFSLQDLYLGAWDSLLSVADSTIAGLGTAGLTLPVIPDDADDADPRPGEGRRAP